LSSLPLPNEMPKPLKRLQTDLLAEQAASNFKRGAEIVKLQEIIEDKDVEIERLRAENERLRKALERYREYKIST